MRPSGPAGRGEVHPKLCRPQATYHGVKLHMAGCRSKHFLAALLPAAVPSVCWLLAELVHEKWCGAWCLKCTHACTVGSIHADWLMVFGLILSPYLLLVGAPLSLVMLVFVLVRKPRPRGST